MRELLGRIRRVLVLGGAAALVVLHLVVLLRRVLDGSLLQPLVVAEWALAFALLGLVVVLRRRGVSVFRGRAGASFWIVVALLHGMVALPGGPGFVGVLAGVPAVTLPLAAGVAVGIAAVLVSLLGAAKVPALEPRFRRPFGGAGPALLERYSSLAPRAPPA